MKKLICILLISFCCTIFIACDSSNEHQGEAKTPSGSSVMKGRDYKDVVEIFEEEGFTNIKLEKVDDLITGWLTKEGEVEAVSVGEDFEYSPGEWVQDKTEVVIRYHVFPEKENEEREDGSQEATENNEDGEGSDEVLTIDNCEELVSILSNKAEVDESYSSFASKYEGRTIEFDGRIDYVTNYENYDTRYEIFVSAGDYDPNHQIGPAFKFKNVAAYNLGLDTLFLEEKIKVGKNVRIVAKVGKFDSNSYLFYLDPILVTER